MDSVSTRQLTSEECGFVSGGGKSVPGWRPCGNDCGWRRPLEKCMARRGSMRPIE